MIELIHAFDVETTGPVMGHHEILAVSFVAVRFDRSNRAATKIAALTLNLKTRDESAWHPTTLEFWRQNPEAWRRNTIADDKVMPGNAAQQIHAHLATIQDVAARNGWDYKQITDNARFDYAWMNHLLGMAGLMPVDYLRATGEYLRVGSVIDVAQWSVATKFNASAAITPQDCVTKTGPRLKHTPESDAEESVELYLRIDRRRSYNKRYHRRRDNYWVPPPPKKDGRGPGP